MCSGVRHNHEVCFEVLGEERHRINDLLQAALSAPHSMEEEFDLSIASFDRLNILIRGHVTTWRGGFYPQLFYIEITDLFIDHRPRIDVRVGYLAVLPAIVR